MGGAGGQGGMGGQGGTGIGVGVGLGGAASVGDIRNNNSATGGSVLGSGNSSNSNRNDNNNSNLNAQGQQQGQGQHQGQGQGQSQSAKAQQGQSQSSRNDNRSSANNQNSNANSGNNASTNVSVGGDTYQAARIPVATAYAPNIVATALCKFGVSGGGQGMTFGFSVGVSITDENCMLLEQVRTVSVILGQKDVAQEMMMAIPAYAEAVGRIKNPKAAAPIPGAGVASVIPPVQAEETDPIKRYRFGLPPLALKK